MWRANLWVIALGSLLAACATTQAPTSQQQPPAVVSPDDQPSNVQHPDLPSHKRGVIVPSDVSMPGGEPPLPTMTETASPGAAPATGAGN
jgi:hypothetical protein